jgi:3-oxoacyl-[acyl-carrier-protein] synthase-1
MAEVRFATADEGATSHLANCIEELSKGEWDALLFGGADSLTDRGTVRAYAARGLCCTDRHPEGILPGEGAAYLLLEKSDAARPALALIAGLGHDLEENTGKASNSRMTALTVAIEQALAQAQCKASQVQSIVLPMGNDIPSALEWYQVQLKLWSDEEVDQSEMEELFPQSAIGDTGAASLPLAFIAGCARFEFNFSPAEKVLVCEVGRGKARGAVFLEKSATSSRPSNRVI